jgi:hypothetical protein
MVGGLGSNQVQLSCGSEKENEPGGIRTRGALIKRYLALDGVAP